jgi:methylated-DNA-[protein]-cysteine S-methyltransferase
VTLFVSTVRSPLGVLVIAAGQTAVCALEYPDEWPRAEHRLRRTRGPTRFVSGSDPAGARRRIERYFEGDLFACDDLPIDPHGAAFDQRVWRELRRVPPGATISYRDLACRVDCPSGFRAVGAANRRNPLAIVIPCHRVIGATGDLRGYAGGLERKRWLLDHEARHSARMSRVRATG